MRQRLTVPFQSKTFRIDLKYKYFATFKINNYGFFHVQFCPIMTVPHDSAPYNALY